MAEKKVSVQFAPFRSALDAGFWHRLSELILDVYGLSDEPRSLHGYYSNHEAEGLPPALNIDFTAFKEQPEVPFHSFLSHGTLKNMNTIEQFKNSDKNLLIEAEGQKIWTDITNGNAIKDSTLLNRFLLITYADLKKYHYYYWFSFPALSLPGGSSVCALNDPMPINNRFSQQQIDYLGVQYCNKFPTNQMSAFLVHESEDDSQLTVGMLSEFDSLFERGGKIIIGFSDPCNLSTNPGWPLRNLLCLAFYHWRSRLGSESVEVLCWRLRVKDGRRETQHSIVLRLSLPEISPTATLSSQSHDDGSLVDQSQKLKVTGWERNDKQKLAPRFLDLSSSMDPARLAESAVDLNLKLMRWRLVPDLNLDLISSTRCLLLGAGTLGCNVARCLLSWGVRHITLVDCGTISYSNPVRQSLFEFNDSLGGGRPKAEAAAEALKRIFPGVNATGISLTIPMPGHPVPDSMKEQTMKDVAQLESLIESHDTVTLLMDTRESRWLPTLIAKHKSKIIISSALGFDTYLVIRHGVRQVQTEVSINSEAVGASIVAEGVNTAAVGAETAGKTRADWLKNIPGCELGCYFCNDVVAPGNSTRDRTLDQQCTVSRPGLSLICSALTVELLVSLVIHPLRSLASASTSSDGDSASSSDHSSALGIVPHQIRGFISNFHQMTPACRAFDRCTACSEKVLEAYEKEGKSFLWKVFNQPSKFLEDLTGLTDLHTNTDNLDDMCLLTDDEECN